MNSSFQRPKSNQKFEISGRSALLIGLACSCSMMIVLITFKLSSPADFSAHFLFGLSLVMTACIISVLRQGMNTPNS